MPATKRKATENSQPIKRMDRSRQIGCQAGIGEKTKPQPANADWGFGFRCLTMTYSHMGKPHTTIGDASFHY